MLEKLKELLGEELSAQVETKLGTVELAIMNDGTVVKADKHDTLKGDLRLLQEKYDADLKKVNADLTTAITNAGDYDTLKGTLATLQGDNAKLSEDFGKELNTIKINSAIKVDLVKEQAKDIKSVLAHIDLSRVTLDGENLIDYTEQRDSTKKDFPYLFGEEVQKGNKITDTKDPDKQKNPWSKEHFNLTEQGRIVRENPSLAETMRNTK